MKSNARTIFYMNTELMGLADKAVHYFREQQYDKALALVAETIDSISYITEAVITDSQYFNTISTESLLELVTGIIAAKRNKDFVLLADLYEMQLLAILKKIQKIIINKEDFLYKENEYKENIKLLSRKVPRLGGILKDGLNPDVLLQKGYRVEITPSGLMTLGAGRDGEQYYFHTNNRIIYEAFLLANHWYSERTECYIIYGFGFGYHITELKKLAKPARIEVYESDGNILQLACAFTDLKSLLQDSDIALYYDPEFLQLKERMEDLGEKEQVRIHYPSLNNINDPQAKEMLESYIHWSKILEYC